LHSNEEKHASNHCPNEFHVRSMKEKEKKIKI
jgi:hypothetical protein